VKWPKYFTLYHLFIQLVWYFMQVCITDLNSSIKHLRLRFLNLLNVDIYI